MRSNAIGPINSYILKDMTVERRRLAWQTPCLHSHILSESPGIRPLPRLPSALLASAAPVAWVTLGEHSSTSLKIQSVGRGWLLLNTIFKKRTSGSYSTNSSPFNPCWISDCILVTDLQSTPTSPPHNHSPAPTQTWQLIGGGRMGLFPALHVHRLFQEPKGFW